MADALREWRSAPGALAHLEPSPTSGDHVKGTGSGPVVVIYLDVASGRMPGGVAGAVAPSREPPCAAPGPPSVRWPTSIALALPAAETLEAAAEQGRFFRCTRPPHCDAAVRTRPPCSTLQPDGSEGPGSLAAHQTSTARDPHRSRALEDLGRASQRVACGSSQPSCSVNGKHYDRVSSDSRRWYASPRSA